MNTLRSAGAVRSSLPRTCLASTSRLAVRHNSTENTFGMTTESRIESAEVRKWRGKGFPKINSLLNRVSVHHPHLWNQGPFKPLTVPKRKKGGRDNTGSISVRHVGGGHKRRLRTVDFYRYHPGVHDVVRIEYDPGRSAHIALIRRREGTAGKTAAEISKMKAQEAEDTFRMPFEADMVVKSGWSYILAPDGLRAGDTVQSFRRGVPDNFVEGWKNELEEGEEISPRAFGLLRSIILKPGNVLPLYLIPTGTIIHNISFNATGKMQAARSAGTQAQLVAHQTKDGQSVAGTDVLSMGHHYDANGKLSKANGHVVVKMTSGEVRKFAPGAVATIGFVSNKEHQQINLGKAGRSRRLGIRPTVRGMAMNAVDHPHGGGKSKSKGGKQAHSYTGKLTRGVRTRRPRDKDGNKAVIVERPRGPHSRPKRS